VRRGAERADAFAFPRVDALDFFVPVLVEATMAPRVPTDDGRRTDAQRPVAVERFAERPARTTTPTS
jgi:hypothetical protein